MHLPRRPSYCGRGQLRVGQHPAGVSAHRSVPAHGGSGDRRPDAGDRATTGLARRRDRSTHFVGLDSWTGYGTFSLAIPDIPPFGAPTAAEFGWALGIGLAGAVVAAAIRHLAVQLRPLVEPRMVLLTPVVGLGVAGLAIAFQEGSDKDSSQVLFSGQDALLSLIQDASDWTVGALVLLVACKALAYVLSLSSLRRPCLSGHVHRGGGRHRALAPPRSADDRRRRHGHRRGDRRNARIAPDRRPADDGLSAGRRPGAHPARDRLRGGRVRRRGQAGTRAETRARPPPAADAALAGTWRRSQGCAAGSHTREPPSCSRS